MIDTITSTNSRNIWTSIRQYLFIYLLKENMQIICQLYLMGVEHASHVAVWLIFSFGFSEAVPLAPFMKVRLPEREFGRALALNEGLSLARIESFPFPSNNCCCCFNAYHHLVSVEQVQLVEMLRKVLDELVVELECNYLARLLVLV